MQMGTEKLRVPQIVTLHQFASIANLQHLQVFQFVASASLQFAQTANLQVMQVRTKKLLEVV